MSGPAMPVKSAMPAMWSGHVAAPDGSRRLAKVLLGPADLDRLFDLHCRILDEVSPGLLNRETREFFAEHLEVAGAVLGLSAGRELVAYAVLGLPAAGSEYNFGRFLGLADSALGLVAHLDGVGVLPAWRGQGLHRLFAATRIELAGRLGRSHVLSTVAPANVDSWRNLFPLGLAGKQLRPMFAAGHLRYLLHRDLEVPIQVDRTRAIAVPVGEIERQRRLVESGWWAIGGEGAGDRAAILLAPRDDRP